MSILLLLEECHPHSRPGLIAEGGVVYVHAARTRPKAGLNQAIYQGKKKVMETKSNKIPRNWRHRATKFGGLSVALLIAGFAWGQLSTQGRQPEKRRDQNVELAMKIRHPFTLVAVGDMLQMVPFSRNIDPDIQFLMKIMREADMTVANAENMTMDMDNYTGTTSHHQAPKEVADDWVNMGIKMVTKANNHTWDLGEAGLYQHLRELERVGIIHVGTGRTMLEARMARYAGTPKGTVGLIGIYTESSQLSAAPTGRVVPVTPEQMKQLSAIRDSIMARRTEVENRFEPPRDPEGTLTLFGVKFGIGVAPAAPGLPRQREAGASQSNTLRLTTYNGVTAEQMAQLRAIAGDAGTGDTLSAFGVMFRVTPKPGEYSYEMNQQDHRDILREVRTGKQFSDFLVVAAHWHQNRFAFQSYSFDHYPADFQIKLAHDVIDQGADAFVAHGVHTLKGVEIYKGKPIFYGVSNFVVQEQMYQSWRDARGGGGTKPPTPLTGPIVGDGEVNEALWEWMQQPDNFEVLLTSSHYEKGQLAEVRLYPVDVGGPDRPGSQLGIPRKPAPRVANRILEKVAEYSKPFGAKITIENGVGIIRAGEAKP
jgi:poly-gamma-glutamate capsule biosynthesis protein CapA/YwtB (metallophosphatase superfamily)